MKQSLILFVVLELAYIAAVRYVVFWGGFDQPEQELWWTGIRLVSLALLWVIFRGLLPEKKERGRVEWYYLLAGAVMCIGPVLVGNWDYKYPLNWIFAVTSFAVGFREEFAYRVVFQTLLTRRMGFWWALMVSNVGFTFYHYGVVPWSLTGVCGIAVFGLAMGILYRLTGSLILIALIHSIFDLIFCFSPFLSRPFPEVWEVMISLMVMGFLIFDVVTKPRPVE